MNKAKFLTFIINFLLTFIYYPIMMAMSRQRSFLTLRKGVNMDTQATKKLVRFGKVLNIVGKVLAVVCFLAALLSLCLVIVAIVLPEGLVINVLDAIDVSSVFAVFQPGTVLADLVPSATVIGLKLAVVLATAKAFVYFLVSSIILFILSAVFKSSATRNSPFLPENVKRLKVVGLILIVVSLFLGLANLIFAFCVLALAFIFQYGMQLQQQADETL